MKKIVVLVALSFGVFASCKDEKVVQEEVVSIERTDDIPVLEELEISEEVKMLYIASELTDCVGVAPMKCMQVKEEQDAPWELMYDNIEGFTYEEGYEYKVEVKRISVPNPPADGSSFRYVLVNELAKEKKA